MRSHGLAVRTSDSESGNPSSILGGTLDVFFLSVKTFEISIQDLRARLVRTIG